MKSKNILFVGNSYTYFHDMPEKIFAPLAESQGYGVNVTSVTAGGYYFAWYCDPENPEGRRLRETVAGKRYDAVILQEQSCNPVRDPQGFLKSAGEIKALLSPCADLFVLYCTWGRREDNAMLESLGMTSQEMTAGLSASYNAAAAAHGMVVSEVGMAFSAYAELHGQADLYDPDGSHPSPLGSRIAAETILNTLCEAGIFEK